MRLRNVKNANDIVNNSNYVLKDVEEEGFSLEDVFQNNNPVHLEIGMGKGDFLREMALTHKDINFIGLEKYESVLVRAIEKVKDLDIPNLKFICTDALNVDKIFNHSIETLYLNFSDPWPKNKHAKRRLTSPLFLEKYESIFKDNPHIIQKTDNIGLFAYSLMSLSQNGYTLNHVSLDLANEDIPNVLTEYEKKFRELGFKINYLDAVKYLQK